MGLNHVRDRTLSKLGIKSKNIKQLMLPIIISGWIVGRGIIELPLGKRWPVTSCLYSLFLIFAYSYTTKVTTDHLDSVLPSSSAMGIWIMKPIIWMNECVIICSILNGWKAMKDVKNIIKDIEASDRKAEKIGIPRDYKSVYCRQLFTLICEVVFAISIMLYAFIWIPSIEQSTGHIMATIICIYYPFIVVSIGDAQFITLVRSITLRFQLLNKVLKKMSTTSDYSPQHKRVPDSGRMEGREFYGGFEKRTNDDSCIMKAASEYHYELVRTGSLINATFGTQALLSMTLSSVCLLGLLYRASALLLWSPLSLDILDKKLGVILGWVLYYIYRIIIMTSACTKPVNECRKTAIIICGLHEPSRKQSFRDEISDFLLQKTQNTIKFSACGLFTLDCSLIQRIIITITTYLIILVQMDGDTKSTLPTESTSTAENMS